MKCEGAPNKRHHTNFNMYLPDLLKTLKTPYQYVKIVKKNFLVLNIGLSTVEKTRLWRS